MMLLVDAGNSRIKWALVKEKKWLCDGVLPVARAGELTQHLADHCKLLGEALHKIEHIFASNVAGAEIELHIRNINVGRMTACSFVAAAKQQCGVRNGYDQAGQLGSDRWAALIGAWSLVHGECLVVNCGTATTIDALSSTGEFVGGLILPGVALMKSSLCDSTVGLTPVQGKYVPLPKNTPDAIYSGTIQASCGAVQRQYELLESDGAPVVLSGGASGALQSHLKMPLHVVDNLVLQGLRVIAQETSMV